MWKPLGDSLERKLMVSFVYGKLQWSKPIVVLIPGSEFSMQRLTEKNPSFLSPGDLTAVIPLADRKFFSYQYMFFMPLN